LQIALINRIIMADIKAIDVKKLIWKCLLCFD